MYQGMGKCCTVIIMVYFRSCGASKLNSIAAVVAALDGGSLFSAGVTL